MKHKSAEWKIVTLNATIAELNRFISASCQRIGNGTQIMA